jgi:hypothetical protein
MSAYRKLRAFSVLAALALSACENNESEVPTEPDAPFRVSIVVVSDPGHPLQGAKVLARQKPIATTDETGLAKVQVTGTEGESVALTVACPQGYDAPDKPVIVGLRRLAGGSIPRFEVRCTPNMRTVVVALRTDRGANLPIIQLGKPIARTGPDGLAHFVMHLRPTEQVTLTLDTSDKASDALRPRSPSLTFVAKDQDELVLLDQKFTVERKPVVVARPRPRPVAL